MEDIISKKLIELNKEYLDLYYSKEFQDYLRKNRLKNMIKSLNIREIFHIIIDKLKYRNIYSTKYNNHTQGKKKMDVEGKKIAVYTCIVGDYDELLEPVYVNPNIEYFAFTDQVVKSDSIWKKIDISKFSEYRSLSPTQLNRLIKILSFKYLPKYDYTIYVDGIIKIVGDLLPLVEMVGDSLLGIHYHNARDCIYKEANAVKLKKRCNKELVNKQMLTYEKKGYPVNNGLYENTILIRNHNHPLLNQLMVSWWEEYQKFPTRDQLCLPYVIWNQKISFDDIVILGSSIDKNERIRRILVHRGRKC